GIKQGATEQNLRIVITATDAITDAEDERAIVAQELASGASALIVQPAPGEGTEEMLRETAGSIPVMLVRDEPLSEQDGESTFPVSAPDSYECGRTLAEMMLTDYAGSLSGKTIGIVSTKEGTTTGEKTLQGFMDGIRDAAGGEPETAWTISVSPGTSDVMQQIAQAGRVDLVAALDTASADAAGEAAEEKSLGGAVVYGISSSEYSVYYLDHDDIAGLVIPNDYDCGWRSITQIAGKLRNSREVIAGGTVEIRTFRREDLFQKENEDFLFMD
ncbi:MAG: substrate-binding domain-containing protein, partial [Lachnospiraceae bacterium]